MPKSPKEPIEIWDASGMTTRVIKRRIKTPEGSTRPTLKLIRGIDTASSIIENKILNPPLYFLMIASSMNAYRYLKEYADTDEVLAASITIYIMGLLFMTGFLPSKSFTDAEKITLKKIGEQVNVEVGEYSLEDDNAYKLLTQFKRKKAELQHSLKPEQAKRITFALGLFDKSEQNKSTLRVFQENELFDENLAAEIVSFT